MFDRQYGIVYPPYLKVVTHVSPEHYVMRSNYVLSVSAHVTQFVAKCMSDSGLLTLDNKIHDVCLQSESTANHTAVPGQLWESKKELNGETWQTINWLETIPSHENRGLKMNVVPRNLNLETREADGLQSLSKWLCECACVRACVRTCVRACMCACVRVHMCACVCACAYQKLQDRMQLVHDCREDVWLQLVFTCTCMIKQDPNPPLNEYWH